MIAACRSGSIDESFFSGPKLLELVLCILRPGDQGAQNLLKDYDRTAALLNFLRFCLLYGGGPTDRRVEKNETGAWNLAFLDQVSPCLCPRVYVRMCMHICGLMKTKLDSPRLRAEGREWILATAQAAVRRSGDHTCGIASTCRVSGRTWGYGSLGRLSEEARTQRCSRLGCTLRQVEGRAGGSGAGDQPEQARVSQSDELGVVQTSS